MSQPAQHLLNRAFLPWISILSIIQVVFIVLHFTSGPHDKSKNNSALATAHALSSKANNQSLSDSEQMLKLGKGMMVTFKGRAGSGTITWLPVNSPRVVSNKDSVLIIGKDGFYFLNLQVTLRTDKGACSLENQSDPVVKVIRTNQSESITLLEGRINRDTCTTGLLAKVALLTTNVTLKVTINIQNPKINDAESVTHLDIIYLSLQ